MIRSVVAGAALLLVSCMADKAPLVATDVQIGKPLPGTQMTSGYLTLSNTSLQPITITNVTSPQFGVVEMHESVLEDGMTRMYKLGELTILGQTSVAFEPGGKHLMLMQPVDELGTVSLQFYAGSAVVLTLDVVVGE